jgi:drug/metabolite transporter (DMT)-like permease
MTGIFWAASAGIFLGIQIYTYFPLLKDGDASEVVSFEYLYPVVVAVFAYFAMAEQLSLAGYAGVALTVAGALLLSMVWRRFSVREIVLLAVFIFSTAFYEIFIKFATEHMGEWQGVALSGMGLALCLSPLLLMAGVRKHLRKEAANFRFALPIESLTLAAVAATYFAMSGLQATVVSAIGAAQPLAVLFLETAWRPGHKALVRDGFRKKLLPIMMIVAGVALLYLTQG